ncbi:hypothetical protein [Hydrogenivirga sp. 128-5-R1-1]|uniref:hypothetical protein n=1 Tax=Hydrogenivirga sp. 128-5-R1-1 TaxID=392423 RepID=UPI00015F267E|nr:hypothetical protein [Hydrogenivirga sp. 128-5-R1-1]EDP74146.1 hypothetical protein HG1285_11507 [Hydrogenivirga sp. 128-5-R1-1]
MEIYKLKHDINGLIFKLETSLQLIKDELEEEDEILSICESSLNNLKTLLELIFTIEKIKSGEYKLNLEEISAGEFNHKNIEIQMEKIRVDRKLFKHTLEVLEKIPSGNLIIKNDEAIFKCNKPFSQIEKFYIDSIILILKMFEINTKVEINE